MPDLQNLLDEIDRLDQEATKGPWIDEDNALREILYHQRNELGGYAGSASLAEVLTNDADAEFIALARNALPQLAKALQAVMEVHTLEEFGDLEGDGVMCSECMYDDGSFKIYPCPTVQAIHDSIGDDGD